MKAAISPRRFAALAGVCIALAAGQAAAELRVAKVVRTETSKPELVSQTASADGSLLELVFKTDSGIFSANLDFAGTSFKRIRIVIQNAKTWEGVKYFPAGLEGKQVIDLRETKGVKIHGKPPKQCIIEFDPHAAKILPPGGKFQFIDAYRQ